MRKIFFCILSLLIIHGSTIGQVTVTVTNPANTTPNLASSYTSLANAVTAVNAITAMSGPVILTCAPGNETAPPGGYSIINPVGTSATNTITFTTSGTVTLTASASLTAGTLTDGIIKLIGADYITISGFTLQENPANTNNVSASNNMTEWGLALLYASTTNGSQHNTIQDNTIILNRNYLNSFGIYSNTRHSASNIAGEILNNTTAPNNSNRFYGNTISNVNCGIALIGSGIAANKDQGNDIGGSSAATGNTITNWGKDTTSSVFVSGPSLGISCIFINDQTNENVSFNTLVSATINYASASYASGIDKEYFGSQPVGTITSNITHNTITIKDSSAAGGFFNSNYVSAIVSQGITALATATININDNIILNCAELRTSSSPGLYGIRNYAAAGVVNINSNIMKGTTTVAPASGVVGLVNNGEVITTLNINNNQLGVAGSGFVSFSGINDYAYGIYNGNAATTCTVNITGNSIDGISARNGYVYGISSNMGGFFTTPAPDFININNNRFGSVTGVFASFTDPPIASGEGVYGINNNIGDSTTIIHIDNNDFTGILYALTSTYGSVSLINQNTSLFSGSVAASTIISGNTFTNLSLNVTGPVTFIYNGNVMVSGNSFTCSNNHIAGTFNKPAAGGSLMCINENGSSATGSTVTITGNDFSNITLTGNTSFYGVSDQAGSFSSGPSKTITGNTFSNVNYGNGSAYGISFQYGLSCTCSSNSITGFNGAGIFTGIDIGSTSAGNAAITNNTVSNITAASLCYGISGGSVNIPVLNINDNTINSITCPNNNPVYIASGATVNIYDNTISGITSSSAAAIFKGINALTCTLVNVYRNKLYGFNATATASGTPGAITGMFFNGSNTTVNIYNNFLANFTAPAFDGADVIRGMAFFGGSNSAFNLYYNSVYLNSGATNTNFGTSCIYHLVNATATNNNLKLINNILVNTSTAAGSGKTIVLYNSSYTTLSNYDPASDYNLLYAGAPSASHLIYFDALNSDQTLAAFQTRVSPREANDISVMPNFVSATDLHLTSNNCQVDGRGSPIAGYTTDVDNAARNTTTPDMGADEFTSVAVNTLAGIAGSAVCESKNVSGGGTVYVSNACEPIAKVLPSGAIPVSGNVSACVTLNATQQTFNGEPYVKRHYDIEPVNSPSTATGTITLYFTDAEFVNYNTLNSPVWPSLPTVAGGANSDGNRANLKVTQFHGAANTSPSSPGNYPGARVLIVPGAANVFWNGTYWEVTVDVSGFSGFYVHTNFTNTPLPVIINYLTGRRQGSNHLLNWKVTCASTPRATMTLERSSDGRTYTGINTITADAARCNSPFDYTDMNPLPGMNYYRLKIVDADGHITYSTTVALLNAAKGIDIISIAPNPVVNDRFNLNIASAVSGKMEIAIFDIQSRLVYRQTLTLTAGFNSLPVNVANLQAGTYTIRGAMADVQSKVIRFVKQ